jgi:hypothetical protein
MYVNSLSETTNYSVTYDYLIVFQCKQGVPIFMKVHDSSPYSRNHVHFFVLTYIYSFLIFMPFRFKIHLNIILPVTHVWDSQAFLVCCSSSYGQASGSAAPGPAQRYSKNRNFI